MIAGVVAVSSRFSQSGRAGSITVAIPSLVVGCSGPNST
jgi:hypothetical protein